MNCAQYLENINPYLDAELESSVHAQFEAHVATCEDCASAVDRRRALREGLKSISVDAPEPGFLDSVTGQAAVELQRNESRFWLSSGIGGAVAAGIIAWLIVALPTGIPTAERSAELEIVSIALNTEKTFHLSFESERALQAAKLTVELPEGTEVVGYEGRNSVRWSTDIQPGTNILKLPIIVRSGTGGQVLAKIEHAGKEKAFKFAIVVG